MYVGKHTKEAVEEKKFRRYLTSSFVTQFNEKYSDFPYKVIAGEDGTKICLDILTGKKVPINEVVDKIIDAEHAPEFA